MAVKFLHFFFPLLLATMAIVSSAEYLDDYSSQEFEMQNTDDQPTMSEILGDESTSNSLRGVSRYLAQKYTPGSLTCDKFPRVCRLKISPGPDCCKKNCVNVKTDKLNCGMCGYKCKYPEICCKGKCVNTFSDKRNCGGCNQKCKKAEFCVYGLCNYA